jgi:hypothetical protein
MPLDAAVQALAAWDLAQALRQSRYAYAAVNALHVLGIALLVGAILPLDLRLLGLWRGVAVRDLMQVLVPTAATGLLLAMATGGLLFAVRAPEYAALPIVYLKLGLVALGSSSAVLLHLRHGATLATASTPTLRRAAALSISCWLGALACGRLIAFVAD